MGAARHTQRAQEHAQRRIARDGLSGYAVSIEDHYALRAQVTALEAERDRLREERDAIARTAAKAGDVIERVMTERDRLRAALDVIASHLKSRREFHAKELKDSRAWTVCDDFLTLLSHYGIVEKDHRAGHGFGGDQ